MSDENLEIIRRAVEDMKADGLHALVAYCSPDVVAYPFPEWMEAPRYEGHSGIRELMDGWTESFENVSLETHEIRDAGGDRVVWLGYITGKIKGSDVPVKQPVGAVQSLGEGLLVESRYFMTWDEALEAAGPARAE